MQSTIILIPSRLASTRLPQKPLADIHGLPMIVHVMKRAQEANIGRVVVACEDQAIADAIHHHGGEAILTGNHHQSGTDRIYEALQTLDPKKTFQHIINLQGDLPNVQPAILQKMADLLRHTNADIATPIVAIDEEWKKIDPSVVKVAVAFNENNKSGKALYFSRATIPSGAGTLYEHVGIYAYTRSSLEKFVALSPSPLEKRERLEQLRALEYGMVIQAEVVDTIPCSVDTPEDLQRARTIMEGKIYV